jgi:hypothetical protein
LPFRICRAGARQIVAARRYSCRIVEMPRTRICLANKKAARITRLSYAAAKSTKNAPICNLIGRFASERLFKTASRRPWVSLKPAGCEQPAGMVCCACQTP